MPNLIQCRALAYSHQNCLCHYCHIPLWEKDPSPLIARFGLSVKQAKQLKCTAEHLIARQDGGRNEPTNIVAACSSCNSKRHRRNKPFSPQQMQLHVQKRIDRRGWHADWVFEKGLIS